MYAELSLRNCNLFFAAFITALIIIFSMTSDIKAVLQFRPFHEYHCITTKNFFQPMNTFLNFTPDNSLQKSRYGIDISGLRLYTFVQYYRYVTPVCATFDTGYAASAIRKKFYFCNYSKLEYFASKLFRLDFSTLIYIGICRHCLPAFLCSSSYILSRSPAAPPNQRTDRMFSLPSFK